MFEATLRYNSNSDKHPVGTSLEYLDSVLVPARMLAANAKALPSNLQNYADDAGVNYYIDPSLTDFRVGDDFRDDSGSVRRWHWEYAEQVDPLLEELLTKQENLDASQLPDSHVETLTKASVAFHEGFVVTQLEEEVGKYDSLSDPDSYRPAAVIPWYHKIRTPSDIEVNDTILTAARDAASLPLKPCLFITKDILRSSTHLDELLSLLSEHNIEQCFIWVENLDKHETGQHDYEHVARFVSDLADAGVSPHFYYGDYFATLLSHIGLDGTIYGSMYGEEDAERREQRGGGGVITRYYLDEVSDFVKIPAVVDVQQRVGAEMCECDVCERQFDSWQDLAALENDDDENIQTPMKKHHLRIRWRQIRQVESESLTDSLDRLESDYQEYVMPFSRSNQVADSKSLNYLPCWQNALEAIVSE
jgi:hypothetical protein